MLGVVITIIVMAFMGGLVSRSQKQTIFVTENTGTVETVYVNGTVYVTANVTSIQSSQNENDTVNCNSQTVYFTSAIDEADNAQMGQVITWAVIVSSGQSVNATLITETVCSSAWTTTGPTQTWTYVYTEGSGSLPETTFSTTSPISITVPPSNSSTSTSAP